jgi:glucosyl-3-phosphoglycerate synthase
MIRSYHHQEFSDLAALAEEKQRLGLTISLCIPTLNEEGTIARIVEVVCRELRDGCALLDEVAVMDSGSTDRTRALAEEAGAEVYLAHEILPNHPAHTGKGENLWKAVHQLRGDILCFVDGDIRNFHPRFVYGTLGPLIRHAEISYVKGFYERPLLASEGVDPRGGGRVTEILVRPLLTRFFPELAGFHQPLAGEYAARRSILESIPFPVGYGVESSHLLDAYARYGSSIFAQTDLDERFHRNRSLAQLGRMSGEILDAFLRRTAGEPSHLMERPPLLRIPEYLSRHPARRP